MNTERFKCFTAKKIKLIEDGKKKVVGLPVGWTTLDDTVIVEGHKVLCIRTGELNNITVVDFDSVDAYNKAIKKYPELSNYFTIKTPRGYHIYGKYTESLKTSTDKKRKIDVRNEGAFVFGAGSIREDGGEYTDFIQGDLNLEFPDKFIKYVSKKKKKTEKLPTPIIKEKKNPQKKIERICDNISTNLLSEYDSWLKIVWAMRNDDDISYEFAKKISQKASNYSDEGFNKVYNDTKYGHQIKTKTLYYYCKKSNSKKFFQICRDEDKNAYCEDSAIQIANRFLELVGDNIVCNTNNENNDLLIWTGEKWRLDKSGDLITNMIEEVMLEYYTGFKDEAYKKHEELASAKGDNTEELEQLSNEYKGFQDIISTINSVNQLIGIYKTVKRKAKAVEHDIKFNMLESQDDNLHFKNGVLNVRTGEFRKKDKYDYMTLNLSWNYEPDKSKISQEITDEINLMFKKMDTEEDINKFIKAWLFYCLTGSTDKQVFLIQLGEDASNGKSTLFSIMGICFEFYTYKLDSKVFDIGYTQAHKQFVNLITKPVRFAYIEELGAKQIDAQLVKDTTDGEMNVNVLYENSSVVKTQAKINVGSNGIPNIKMDNGTKRRMKIKECKSKFVDDIDEDDYENRLFKKDESLKEKFYNDDYKNAFLHILLEHKELTIPSALNKFTDEIQGECDPFKSALEEYFIITEEEADRTNVTEIQNALSSGSYNSKTIKANMRRLGFKVKVNLMYNNKKGCYTGIRMKHDNE